MFWGAANQNTYHAFTSVVRFATFMPPGNFSRVQPHIPLGNVYLLTPPPLPRNFHRPSVGREYGYFLDHTMQVAVSLLLSNNYTDKSSNKAYCEICVSGTHGV